MPHHYTECTLPYTSKQLFDLVADIESYPKFIPWCSNARVYDYEGDTALADLIIEFKGISGKYTSRVLLDEKAKEISVELAQGPFHHLYQGWKFIPTANGTRVEFDIDFKIRNFLLEKVVDMMFETACDKMMEAFKKRADQLYKMNV